MRSNQNSDLSSVAPDATVANDRKDLRRIRIENDILGKDEILGHGSGVEEDGFGRQNRDELRRFPNNPLLTLKFQPRAVSPRKAIVAALGLA